MRSRLRFLFLLVPILFFKQTLVLLPFKYVMTGSFPSLKQSLHLRALKFYLLQPGEIHCLMKMAGLMANRFFGFGLAITVYIWSLQPMMVTVLLLIRWAGYLLPVKVKVVFFGPRLILTNAKHFAG